MGHTQTITTSDTSDNGQYGLDLVTNIYRAKFKHWEMIGTNLFFPFRGVVHSTMLNCLYTNNECLWVQWCDYFLSWKIEHSIQHGDLCHLIGGQIYYKMNTAGRQFVVAVFEVALSAAFRSGHRSQLCITKNARAYNQIAWPYNKKCMLDDVRVH